MKNSPFYYSIHRYYLIEAVAVGFVAVVIVEIVVVVVSAAVVVVDPPQNLEKREQSIKITLNTIFVIVFPSLLNFCTVSPCLIVPGKYLITE